MLPPAPDFSLTGSEPNLLVRACNQLGQFLQHRETNLRYLALESMCTLASSEFSHEAVKTHIDTVINALKASPLPLGSLASLRGSCPLGHRRLVQQPGESLSESRCHSRLHGLGPGVSLAMLLL